LIAYPGNAGITPIDSMIVFAEAIAIMAAICLATTANIPTGSSLYRLSVHPCKSLEME